MKMTLSCLMLVAFFLVGTAPAQVAGDEPIVGGPCEGCEAVFQGLPEELTSSVRLAPEGEPGEPMRLTGRVFDAGGEAAPGVVVYAYQTDAEGIYRPLEDMPRAARRHGMLRAWTVSDNEGHYGFLTVRPGSYPGTSIPQHIHLHIIEPGRCTYYIEDVRFTDDPFLPEDAAEIARERGGPGLDTPVKDDAGVWQVTRDIVLGQNISGYPE